MQSENEMWAVDVYQIQCGFQQININWLRPLPCQKKFNSVEIWRGKYESQQFLFIIHSKDEILLTNDLQLVHYTALVFSFSSQTNYIWAKKWEYGHENIEDEIHVMLKCKLYDELTEELFDLAVVYNPSFNDRSMFLWVYI